MDREAQKNKAVDFWWHRYGKNLKEYLKNWASREEAVMLFIEISPSPIANYYYPELMEKIEMELENNVEGVRPI